MTARGAANRAWIDRSWHEPDDSRVVEAYAPPIEAMDDLDWRCNESSSEMGEQSSLGAALERVSQGRELTVVDLDYMHGKRPGVYGKSLAGPWTEFVPDANYGEDGGYTKEVWGDHPEQTHSGAAGHFGVARIRATEMTRNIDDVLGCLSERERALLLAQHAPVVHTATMRKVFGRVVRIAHLSVQAKQGFAGAGEGTMESWLEGVAARFTVGKSLAGEKPIVLAIRKVMAIELRAAYAAFEQARATHAKGRRFPHQDPERQPRRLSLVGA